MKKINEEIELSEDQQKAFKQFKEWLHSDEQFWTLMGYAGTGKTTMLDYFVNYAQKQEGEEVPAWSSSKMRPVVTATTNKAVKVLKDRVDCRDFMTIHSLLNIRPKKKGRKEIFEQINFDMEDILKYDLIIIDECSMISEKLFGIIEEQIKDRDIKVLFCGDPAQLPPINEDKSLCFQFEGYELTEVIRHSDVISQTAKRVRSTTELVPTDSLVNPPDIKFISLREAKQYFYDFHKHRDQARLLAWRNKRVKQWNKKLREADWIHRDGEVPDLPYVKGDIIVANEPCVHKDGRHERVLLLNSEEAEILKVNEEYDSYHLRVERLSGAKVWLKVIKKEYYKTWKKTLDQFAAANNWKDFWKEKKKYHNIRHAYSLTVHKSQGSTFQHVIIDPRDINLNRKTTERNQLLYVALTRAAKQVHILR